MAVVEKVLRLAADGLGHNAIQTRLFREGVPSPTGKPEWDWSMITKIVYNDAYRPHTFEEISALLAPEVAAMLDPDKEYGVQWYNRQRITERTISEPSLGATGPHALPVWEEDDDAHDSVEERLPLLLLFVSSGWEAHLCLQAEVSQGREG